METQMQQGRFTQGATAVAKTLAIRSDVDWIETWNVETMTAVGGGSGVKFFWQRGMDNGTALQYYKAGGTHALLAAPIATGGFTLTNTTLLGLGGTNALTDIAAGCVVTSGVGWVNPIVNGDIVRLFSVVGAHQLEGIDFQVGTVTLDTVFTLANMPAIVAAGAPGASAIWRKVNFDPYWYPAYRYIASITVAASAVVTTTVDHKYTVGQVVRMNVPAAYGMQEMNGLTGTVTAITASTFTLNINSTGFTAFAFPLTAAAPFTPATVVPFGDAASTTIADPYATYLGGTTYNQGLIGITLATGANSPAGIANQTVYWRAGKSYIVDNV